VATITFPVWVIAAAVGHNAFVYQLLLTEVYCLSNTMLLLHFYYGRPME